MTSTLRGCLFYKGIAIPEYQGRCTVCGDLVPPDVDMTAVHTHPGHPRSFFDEAGNYRGRTDVPLTELPLTAEQTEILDRLLREKQS